VRQLMEMAIGDRRARILTLLALAALAAMLIFLPTSSAQEAANNRLFGYIALGLLALVAIFSLAVEARDLPFIRANLLAAGAARAARKTGRVMPIPPLPRNLSKVQRERQPDVEDYARQLIEIPWGQHVTITGPDLRLQFDQAVTVTRRIAGDWRKLSEPIAVFARMPAPWCYIGAAEVMQRLSFLVGGAFSPIGLRQGLRFIAQAQAVDPDNADALITRARLLTSVSDKRWLWLAEETLARAQAIAPSHPRLPMAEATLFERYGQKEKALACVEQGIARAKSPTDQVIARITYANMLLGMGRYDDAVSAYYTLLQTEQNDPWLWHNLSIALYNLQRYDEALSCNQRALSIMPFNAAFSFGETIRKKLAERIGGGGYA
jgi:tetratricopeptide (TPR) repeat protein